LANPPIYPDTLADVALAPPRNGIVEIAGPERSPFNEIETAPISHRSRAIARAGSQKERAKYPDKSLPDNNS
jgi:hypothetical protein